MNVISKKKLTPLILLLVLGVAGVSAGIMLVWTSQPYTTTVQGNGINALSIKAGVVDIYTAKTATPATLGTFMLGLNNLTPYRGAGSKTMIIALDNVQLQATDSIKINIQSMDGATPLDITKWTCIAEIVDISKASDTAVAVIKTLTLVPNSNSYDVTIPKADAMSMVWESVVTGHPAGGTGNALFLTFTYSTPYDITPTLHTYGAVVALSVVSSSIA